MLAELIEAAAGSVGAREMGLARLAALPLQNVIKHAAARNAWVVVEADAGRLSFEVATTAAGWADRLEALGGRLDLRWDARGTRVLGTVPVPRTSDTPERAGLAER